MAGFGAPATAHSSGHHWPPCLSWPARRPGGGIGSSGQQQPRDLGQPVGAGRVELVPPGGTGRLQSGPPGPGVLPGGQLRVTGEHFPDPDGVTEITAGADIVAGDPRVTGRHPGRPAQSSHGCWRPGIPPPLPGFRGARLNLGHELGLARVTVSRAMASWAAASVTVPGVAEGAWAVIRASAAGFPVRAASRNSLARRRSWSRLGAREACQMACHLLASASWSATGAPRRRHSGNRGTCCRGGLSPSRGPGRALNAHGQFSAWPRTAAGSRSPATAAGLAGWRPGGPAYLMGSRQGEQP